MAGQAQHAFGDPQVFGISEQRDGFESMRHKAVDPCSTASKPKSGGNFGYLGTFDGLDFVRMR
jgi:hypothetical protein